MLRRIDEARAGRGDDSGPAGDADDVDVNPAARGPRPAAPTRSPRRRPEPRTRVASPAEPRAPKEPRAAKEPRSKKEPRAPKEPRSKKEPRAPKEPRAAKEPRAKKEPRAPKKSRSSRRRRGRAGRRNSATSEFAVPLTSEALPSEPASDPTERPAPAGVVYRRRRRRWPWGLLLILIVAGGAWGLRWYRDLQERQTIVPNVVGLSIDEARARLGPDEWTVVVNRVRRDGAPADQVLAQNRDSGDVVVTPASIELTVSDGDTLVPLPDVVGRPEAEVRALLDGAALVVGTTERPFDGEVAEGVVIAATASDSVDGSVPRHSAVDLVVSAGRAPSRVPGGIIGATLATAEARSSEAGLRIVRHDEASATVPEGRVTRTSPEPNAAVEPGAAIEVWISTGPPPTLIPDVAGRNVTEATAMLAAQGYPVSGVDGPVAGTVVSSDPAAGSAQAAGTAVRLQTS